MKKREAIDILLGLIFKMTCSAKGQSNPLLEAIMWLVKENSRLTKQVKQLKATIRGGR